jgi:hypothetical protein
MTQAPVVVLLIVALGDPSEDSTLMYDRAATLFVAAQATVGGVTDDWAMMVKDDDPVDPS